MINLNWPVSKVILAAFVLTTTCGWSQLPTYYYQGNHRVDIVVQTNELSLSSDNDDMHAISMIKAAAPKATIKTSPDSDRISFSFQTADMTQLNQQGAMLETQLPGTKLQAVVRTEDARQADQSQFLTNRLAFKLPAMSSLAEVTRKMGLTDVQPVPYSNNTFIATIASQANPNLLASLLTANSMQEKDIAEWAAPLIAKQAIKRSVPNDPLFPNQWHLQNTGFNTPSAIAGNDLNIVDAWDIVSGTGVNIAISDDGLQTTHPDLMANVRLDLGFDFNSNDTDPTPEGSFYYGPLVIDSHGTACAGVSAGKGHNGIGISGSAPDASLVGLRLIAQPTVDQQEADGMNWKVAEPTPHNQVAINSNSWGPSDNGATVEGPGPLTEAALANGVANGRNGKGTVYIWAAGNGRQYGDNINKDGYANSPYVIAVGATSSAGASSYYSEPGSAMLVNAPSSHLYGGITTTDLVGAPGYNTSDYTDSFGGTSSAAPAAAGVVALMLQANPALTYRDVMHILLRTTTKNDSLNPGWFNNGAGLQYNHNYGFGRIDALAAVSAAQTWLNVPAQSPVLTALSIPQAPIAIPDNTGTSVTIDFPISSSTQFFIEHVELEANITHTYRGDLKIQLQSPYGTISQLMTTGNDSGDNYMNWRFRSVAHWGENPNGTWKILVSDNFAGDIGVVNSMKLRVSGYATPTSSAQGWALY